MPDPDYSLEHFGKEREPVVVIDGFSGEPERLSDAARRARYMPVESNAYPGIRASINPKSYVGRAQKAPALARALRTAFGFTGNLNFESAAFSIVTRAPSDLTRDQRMPHFDDCQGNVIALVHYLRADAASGTAFYRHIRTGIEAVTPDKLSAYKAAQGDDESEYGNPPPAYHVGSSRRYEWIGEVSAQTDRMIAYRGRQLHSGNIIGDPSGRDPLCDGRITITGFIVGS